MRSELAQCQQDVSACFDTVFANYGPLPVEKGMRYAVTGGKCLRAFLVMESAALYGIPSSQSVWPATAIEALHAYSLVHDDLPCMDDDDLRRGQPTIHKRWDDATAVLVGDALQTLAFELLTRPEMDVSSRIRVDLIADLAKRSGANGMVLGQAQDIAAETAPAPLSLDQIIELQGNKTGALIEWSARAGAVLAGQNPEHLTKYAQALGLAFQIHDDVLDVEGDATKIGKAVGKDADAGKATFVSLLGLDGAKSRASDLIDEAIDSLVSFDARADGLRQVARFVISREA